MISCPAKPHSKANVKLLRTTFWPQKLFVTLNFHPEVRGHRFPDCGKRVVSLLQMERLQCGPFPLWTKGNVMSHAMSQVCVHDCSLVLCVSSLCSGHVKSMSAVWHVFRSSLAMGKGGFEHWHSKHFHRQCTRFCHMTAGCFALTASSENFPNTSHSVNATSRHWFAYAWNQSAMTVSLFCLCLSAMCSSRSPNRWNSWIRGPSWSG